MGREYSKVFSAKVAQAGGLRFWQAISLPHGLTPYVAYRFGGKMWKLPWQAIGVSHQY